MPSPDTLFRPPHPAHSAQRTDLLQAMPSRSGATAHDLEKMPHVHDHRTAVVPPCAPLGDRPGSGGHPVTRHPSWCSPQYCFLDEDGVQVHEQAPVRWEECEVRFESRLLFPTGNIRLPRTCS
jgi:hypothetical protein